MNKELAELGLAEDDPAMFEAGLKGVDTEQYLAAIEPTPEEQKQAEEAEMEESTETLGSSIQAVAVGSCAVLVLMLALKFGFFFTFTQTVDIVVPASSEHVGLQTDPQGQWWYSDHPEIVAVSGGKFTGVSPGEARVCVQPSVTAMTGAVCRSITITSADVGKVKELKK